MHSMEPYTQSTQRSRLEKTEKPSKESSGEQSLWNACLPNSDLNLDEKFESSDLALKGHAKQKECGLGLNIIEDQACSRTEVTSIETKNSNSSYSDNNSGDVQQKVSAGAIWDVFHRQDVPKLNEFLRVHWEEFTSFAGQPVNSCTFCIVTTYVTSLFPKLIATTILVPGRMSCL